MHWFDKVFHHPNGPGSWAKATLVRYADDFVIMAKYMTNNIKAWTENTIEKWLNLTINKEKTKIVNLAHPKSSLNFLGYTLRKIVHKERPWVNISLMTPSDKSLKKAKEKIREITNFRKGYTPVPLIVKEINLFLRGWGSYFSKGNPSKAFSKLNEYVQMRMYKFLNRRSQKGFKKRNKQQSWYKNIKNLGTIQLTKQFFVRKPKTRVYREAGCGKSACPV